MISRRLFCFMCVLLFGFATVSCTDSKMPNSTIRPVKTLKVEGANDIFTAIFPGRAEPIREVNLAFEVSGRLEKLPVKSGDSVDEGVLIAQLNQDTYKALLAASRARYKKANNTEGRLRRLLLAGSVSQAQYDDAKTDLDIALSELNRNEKQLLDTTLRSPFKGQVTAVYLDNYTFVAAPTQVARIVDISQLEMWVNVPESFAKYQDRLEAYTVSLEFDTYPGQFFPAVVKDISREASRQTRTYPASLVMDQPDGLTILPGMSGRAHVRASMVSLGVAAPVEVLATALFAVPGQKQSSVWLVQEDKVVRRQVVIGEGREDRVQILEGLSIGDEIVVAGVHHLQEGQVISRLQ